MSIARMLHADLVVDAAGGAALVERLVRAGIFHVVDLHRELDGDLAALERPPVLDAAPLERPLASVRQVLETFDRFAPQKKGMLQGFFGSPPHVTEATLHERAHSLDLGDYAPRLAALVEEHDRAVGELAAARALAAELEPWRAMDADLASIARDGRACVVPVRATPAQQASLAAAIAASPAAGDIAWQEAGRDERTVHGVVVSLVERRSTVEDLVRRSGASVVKLPSLAGTPAANLERLAAEAGTLDLRRESAAARIVAEADDRREAARALFDDLSSRRRDLHVPRSFFSTATVTVARGWVREADRPRLEALAADSGADLVLRPPAKGETPPVHLENRGLLKPFQILLQMFGLPAYAGFDPTPFVAVAMTLFYAICFGDVGYGLVQVLLAALLKRRFRPAEGTRLFLDLFIEMGVAAAAFGLLTWSFFGASPGYAPGGPKILGVLPLFSPTTDVLAIIGLSLGIGLVFQLASIVAGMVNALRFGDRAAAAFDFGAWFAMLVGILGWVAAKMLPGTPAWAGTASLAVAGAAALVIVAFAGRDAKGIGGRLMTGVISLYGIVGAYGIVSFFSDALSYSRLAILNLTSGFIALVGNLMGGLIVTTESVVAAAVSFLLGAVILVVFHALNLMLGMLGSFIHSLRLNYLESFSRYYRTGGTPFLPLRREGTYHRFEH